MPPSVISSTQRQSGKETASSKLLMIKMKVLLLILNLIPQCLPFSPTCDSSSLSFCCEGTWNLRSNDFCWRHVCEQHLRFLPQRRQDEYSFPHFPPIGHQIRRKGTISSSSKTIFESRCAGGSEIRMDICLRRPSSSFTWWNSSFPTKSDNLHREKK